MLFEAPAVILPVSAILQWVTRSIRAMAILRSLSTLAVHLVDRIDEFDVGSGQPAAHPYSGETVTLSVAVGGD